LMTAMHVIDSPFCKPCLHIKTQKRKMSRKYINFKPLNLQTFYGRIIAKKEKHD